MEFDILLFFKNKNNVHVFKLMSIKYSSDFNNGIVENANNN